jgi:hypothetical protein
VDVTDLFEAEQDLATGEIDLSTYLETLKRFRDSEIDPEYYSDKMPRPSDPADDIEKARISIGKTTALPGETVSVTTSATFADGASLDNIRIRQQINPALSERNINITDAGKTFVTAYQSSSGMIASVSDRSGTYIDGPADSVAFEYEVTIPENASAGTTYSLPGSVQLGDSGPVERFGGDTTIDVISSEDGSGASMDSATRSLSKTSVMPGEEVDVSLDIAISGSGRVNITESISPAPSDTKIKSIDAGESAISAKYNKTTGEISAAYEDVDTATLTYTLVVPDDTAVTTYEFNGIDASGDRSLTIERSDITSATREVTASTITPGSTVSISVDATFRTGAESRSITDKISPTINNESVAIVSDSGATISGYQERTGTVTANYGSSKSSGSLEYEITIPDDAEVGDSYELSLKGTDNNKTITVGDEGDPAVRYANGDGFVDAGGLGDAASDFRAGKIDPGILGKVAAAFRSGKTVV